MRKRSIEQALKRTYVSGVRGVAVAARATKIDAALERRSDNRTLRWLRSLLAIHDLDEMIRLDVPWWTYDAIDVVASFLRDRPNARVFEYGSGASTIWLAKRAAQVQSVEHDGEWGRLMAERLDAYPNISLSVIEADETASSDPLYRSTKHGYREATFERYARAIDAAEGPFDLIVVDGRGRNACLKHATPQLAAEGLIVFDNSHRKSYKSAIERCGLRIEVHKGLAPALPYPDETTLLWRDAPASGDPGA